MVFFALANIKKHIQKIINLIKILLEAAFNAKES